MVKAMYSGVAGLKAHQSKMDVIGNNIANVNTWGYKSMNTSFKESIYQTLSGGTSGTTGDGGMGGTNPAMVGYGTMVSAISSNFTTGTQVPTGRALDVFIDGTAFFAVGPMFGGGDAKSPGDLSLSRVGDFGVINNYLVDGNGRYVYGFSLGQGGEVYKPKTVTDIKTEEGVCIPNDKLPKTQTKTENGITTVTTYTPDQEPSNGFMTVTTTTTEAKSLNDFAPALHERTSVDDLRTKVAALKATYDAAVTAGTYPRTKYELNEPKCDQVTITEETAALPTPPTVTTVDPCDPAGVPGAVQQSTRADIDAYILANTAGEKEYKYDPTKPSKLTEIIKKTKTEAIPIPPDESTPGADGSTVTISYKDQVGGTVTKVTTTVTAATDDTEKFGPAFDDGRMVFDNKKGTYTMAPGVDTLKPLKLPTTCTWYDETGTAHTEENVQFGTFRVDGDGMLYGTSTKTEKTYMLGCIALVNVPNPSGMAKSDGPYHTPGGSSGDPDIIQPGGTAGKLKSEFLESANVDIATEFSEMITTQRGFQANSKIITVTDEMLQELVNMKR